MSGDAGLPPQANAPFPQPTYLGHGIAPSVIKRELGYRILPGVMSPYRALSLLSFKWPFFFSFKR